jgi:hypothetical protein
VKPEGRYDVLMLLDNHYGPDPRVAFELELLEEAGISARVVAWDRRSKQQAREQKFSRSEVIRIAVPAPPGGVRRTLLALFQFAFRVWRERRRLLQGASLLIVHDVYLLPLGRALSLRLGLPFIYDAHEEYAKMEAGRRPAWVLKLVRALESRLARSARAVVVPGASRAARWDGVIERPPIVLPNLVRRNQSSAETEAVEWDLLSCGSLSEGRRPDLLVELARIRPHLRVGIAGRGRSEDYLARAADELPNLTYLGWRSDTDELLARTGAIYYGLDPDHPYSDVACPNTLYQALLHRKPLIFFCGGEPARLATEFKIGIRCEVSASALSAAVDQASKTNDWEFDEAWRTVWLGAETQKFVDVVETAARQSP